MMKDDVFLRDDAFAGSTCFHGSLVCHVFLCNRDFDHFFDSVWTLR